MSTLITNVPPVKVWVRKEYLRDLRDGHGEYVLGYWVSVKSLPGRCFYFETYLPTYGALYDKLPISAFLAWDSDHPDAPVAPNPDLPIEELQFWNCFSHDITTLEKNLTYTMEWQIRTKTQGALSGDYLFTIDSYNGDRSTSDLSFAETPDEHKSFNVIALDNGQFAAQPNNRIIWRDNSLIPGNLNQPDFKVCTQNYAVETEPKWWTVGHTDEWQYKTEDGA